MKRCIIFLFLLMFLSLYCQARIRYVDKNGTYSTIQSALDAAVVGDTVRISPGIYDESITITKNIVVQGGGLNTKITTNQGVGVQITAGKLMWVHVTEVFGTPGDGIQAQNSIVTNCIVTYCSNNGFTVTGTNCTIKNCISAQNDNYGFYAKQNSVGLIINCIAYKNPTYGFRGYSSSPQTMLCKYCISDKLFNNTEQTYCLKQDPGFLSEEQYRLSVTSPCVGTGDPLLLNLDGSRSDMGFWGGPDAPLLPYITIPINYKLNSDGTIQFDMQGKVGY